jgi:DNA-binding NtrC family response regulator
MARKKKALIVDDNPNMASLLSEMFDLIDLPSTVSTDGETALRLLGEHEFNVVVTDLKMPGMSGAQLLTAIKQKRPDLPVIVISGYNVGTSESKLVEGLADGFINKPFKMAHIQEILGRLL